MALDIADLSKSIIDAIVPIIKKGGDDARDFAAMEGAKMAQTLVSIEQLHAAGTIDDDQARALLEMQKLASQNVLLTLEGIGILTAQRAVNAAFKAVAGVVNDAVHFTLLPA